MENRLAWAYSACARVLRPVVRLALTMGLKHAQLDELLRDLLLQEARRLWQAEGVVNPNISQLSVATGLNRKAVTAKVRETVDPLPSSESSAAAKAFTLWLQMAVDDPARRRLPLAGEGHAMSFELLARQISRGNWHHRAILDELVRLKLVSEQDGHAELLADGFVPQGDLQSMLSFLGDNARDHLLAAVSNLEGNGVPMLERAVFAKGLSLKDCVAIETLVRKRWSTLHHELAAKMTRSVNAADGEGAGRIRVGIYTYYEDASQGIDGKPSTS